MRPEHHEPGWSLRLTAKNPTSQRVIVAGSRIQSVGASEHGPHRSPLCADIVAKLAPIRSSVIVFVRDDVVPHIAARETHQRS
jgi:hypothetical protein